MDVKGVIKGVNPIDKYENYNGSQANATPDYVKVSAVPKDEEVQDDKNGKDNSATDNKKLNEALTKLNKLIEGDRKHAEYSVHKELGTIMIKIIDDDTKKVVLEAPSEKILDMVASMCEKAGLIDKKA